VTNIPGFEQKVEDQAALGPGWESGNNGENGVFLLKPLKPCYSRFGRKRRF